MPLITNIPEEFICPITLDLIKDPVTIDDDPSGQLYERVAIEDHFKTKNTNPLTNADVVSKVVKTNPYAQRKIKEFLNGINICSTDQFLAAITSGDIEQLKKLNYTSHYFELTVELSFKVNSINYELKNCSILHAAARQSVEIVNLFLEEAEDKNALLTAKSTLDFTPLHVAALSGQAKTVDLLLNAKVQVDNKATAGATALFLASANGHVDAVKLLLQAKANPNVASNNASTALHMAAEGGYAEVIKLLIDAGAHIEAKDNGGNHGGNPPLNWAACKHHVEAVKVLIEYRAQIDHSDNAGWTPLHWAVHTADVFDEKKAATIELLLQAKANPNNKNNGGQTPLHLAAQNGNAGVARLLIEAGANINQSDNAQMTPLHWAVSNAIKLKEGGTEAIELLLNAGADPNSQTQDGDTALHLVAPTDRSDIVQLLLPKKANPNSPNKREIWPITLAAVRNQIQNLKLLLAAGGNSNYSYSVSNQNGTKRLLPALLYFIEQGETDVAEVFIDAKANVNMADEDGLTPLHYAARQGLVGITKLLLAVGADPNTESKVGEAPLQIAVKTGYVDIVKLLLSAKANPNITVLNKVEEDEFENVSLLYWAVTYRHNDIVKMLLELNSDPNFKSKSGFTVLHQAVWTGQYEIAQLLLQSQANPNCQDDCKHTPLGDCKHTPLHDAALKGNQEMIKLLIDYGADIKIRDNLGKTPDQVAAANGHQAAAVLIRQYYRERKLRARSALLEVEKVQQKVIALEQTNQQLQRQLLEQSKLIESQVSESKRVAALEQQLLQLSSFMQQSMPLAFSQYFPANPDSSNSSDSSSQPRLSAFQGSFIRQLGESSIQPVESVEEPKAEKTLMLPQNKP